MSEINVSRRLAEFRTPRSAASPPKVVTSGVHAPLAEPNRELTVYFAPFSKENPYQPQLASELRSLGIHVTPHRSLRGLIRRICLGIERPDIVHLHWLPRVERTGLSRLRAFVFVVRLKVIRLLRCRIVWTVHNLYHHEATWRGGERWLNRQVTSTASRIIVHSDSAASLVAREFKVADHRKIAVVPHGTYEGAYENTISASEARAKLQLDPGAVVFLFFGNIRPYKGVPELIAAYQQVETSTSALVIAGKVGRQMEFAAIERSIAGSASIHLRAGFVPDDEVQQYMNASDVVVLPYQDVLTSGAAILAMSFGRACVAPALGSLKDVLCDQGAFFYDPDRPDGLRKAMARALQSRNRLAAMGAHNRERVRQWGWDSVARQTSAVYAAALGDRPPIGTPVRGAVGPSSSFTAHGHE